MIAGTRITGTSRMSCSSANSADAHICAAFSYPQFQISIIKKALVIE